MVNELLPTLEPHHVAEVTSLQDLAKLLRQLRRRHARRQGDSELTYRELAAKTGWSIGIISGYFGGRALPPTDRFDILVSLLDTTPIEQGMLATARDRVQENRRRTQPRSSGRPVPRQLPSNNFGFTGRAAECAALDALSRSAGRIIVLSGTAGVGKTALAVHWAHRASKRFPDGQLYVDLRGFDPSGPPMTPAEAVRGLLDSLGVAASSVPADPAAQVGLYRSLLANQRFLVILDNACDAEQVRPLLPGSRGSMTVVTSRTDLTSVVAVDGAHSLILDLLPVEEARELLAQRLGPARVAAEPQVVDEVVHRCARLPLALAIAAARAGARPTFPLATLARELRVAQGSLDPFVDDDVSADARAAFSCSYQHLHTDAATMFRCLGTHAGPDIAAAAAASLAGTSTTRARMALADLARAHLVTEPTPGRYTFHDLLGTFAREQAQRHDTDADRREVMHRALEHYLHTAHTAALLLYPQRDPIAVEPPRPQVTPERLHGRDAARAWFETEHRVLLAAVQQAADTERETLAWQLAWALADYLDWHGYWHDLAGVQTLALDAATRAADQLGQAHAHRNLARAHVRLGRLDDAHTHLGQAVRLASAIGDHLIEASSHLNLSLVLERRAQHRRALTHSHRAHDIFRAAGHRAGQAKSLNAIGWYQTLLGEHENALDSLTLALHLQLHIGCRNDLPSTLDSLGYAQHNLGRHGEAAISYQRAVDLYRESGDRYHEADTLIHLGDAHYAAGDASAALAARRLAMEVLDALPHPQAANLRARLAEVAGSASRRLGPH